VSSQIHTNLLLLACMQLLSLWQQLNWRQLLKRVILLLLLLLM
jgi:hypothetical protein